ncbi:MAG: HAMP domain-containing protein [Proteobacteria bacterium]|nr:HAMP domain-containing protein [Pseudomonadota bacterium]
MKIPNTLFFKTASTLIIALLLLSVIILASTAYFVLVPVGKRSADDLAALLVLSAQTWTELPPETRPDFEMELINAHGIKLLNTERPLGAPDHLQIYIYQHLLQQSLEKRLGGTKIITIGTDARGPEWIWIDIPMPNDLLRFGISAERIGARPPFALIAMAIAVVILAIGTALIIAMRLSRPLALLSAATTAVGRGEKKFVPEDKEPDEIVTLARNFNRMSRDVSGLLENRTTLLAGISHDLRTPLTRIRLALEINPDTIDTSLRAGLEHDVEEMEQLLEQALLLARGVEEDEPLQNLDLVMLLTTLAAQTEAEWQVQHPDCGCHIEFQADDGLRTDWQWPVPKRTLLRVLHNLIENSLRYGNNKPIVIQLTMQDDLPLIHILDRGPGIPEEKREAVFRPFYRLEGSRNPMTGGSGLGLAIVRQLCQAQGWQITLHPRSDGGTEARLLLAENNY